MKKKISLIVAASENNVIAQGQNLPWDLPDDLKYFRSTTAGHPVIMGRLTHEAIGRPMPKRHNVIISRQPNLEIEGCDVVSSLEEAIALVGQDEQDEAFVVGGGQIYIHAMDFADRIYLTRVHAEVEGNVTFPEFSEDEWELVSDEPHPADEHHSHAFSYRVYDRRK